MILETDYLIIGSGAVGMAFADVLLTETDAKIIIVDKHAKPGGHWNVAYPFVKLHQPSQFYGVSSRELSNGRIEEVGLNKGLFHMASGAEVSAYFDEVMQATFLPTGRVKYFPLCEYKGDYKFNSMLTGEEYEVKVNNKLVDATYLKTSVPATHTPNFTVAKGVNFIPINDLTKISIPSKGFVVIGGGKTGVDACLWLLENKVNPDLITWIVSRDAWMIDRETAQPTATFFEKSIGNQANQFEAVAEATSIADMFDKLEEKGVLVRIDKAVRPKMFHGATISQLELEELRKIKHIIRKGRVQSIERDQIILKGGTIPTSSETIHVDCSASAIPVTLKSKPIFSDNLITPQTIRSYQPVFSAAVIAYVEANYETEKEKNKLCGIVPLPNHDIDWLKMTAAMMRNQFNWSQDKPLRRWMRENRLDGFGKMIKDVDKANEKHMAILKRLKDNMLPAMMNLQKFISESELLEQTAIEYPQFQVNKSMFFNGRLVEVPKTERIINDGEVLVKVNKFAYTANNITYAVVGDLIGYWQFFPAMGENSDDYGVIPVWGFAEVVASKVEGIPIGDRLFGYFPPASHLKMVPTRVREHSFIDGAEHRSKLPSAYNRYRRVSAEKDYDPAMDNATMMLFPLHLTSFCIWDVLQDKDWYAAKQIIILGASSKTSTGLAYALKADTSAPRMIGVTSSRNLEMVCGLNLYDQSITYDSLDLIDSTIPSVIVDMSGNSNVLLALHTVLADNMKWCINVGITHWDQATKRPKDGIITQRSEFFFAPSHIQRRIKEWGPNGFNQRTSTFMMETAIKTQEWLTFKKISGLLEMAKIHQAVAQGKIPANEGLIIEL